jgi:hypothetical protein
MRPSAVRQSRVEAWVDPGAEPAVVLGSKVKEVVPVSGAKDANRETTRKQEEGQREGASARAAVRATPSGRTLGKDDLLFWSQVLTQ